ESEQKRALGLRRDRALANEEPKGRDSDETRQKRPEKNFLIGMPGGFEEPERSERPADGADRVHQALEAEGAAVSSRWHVGSEQGLFCGSADTAAEPCGAAAEEHRIG